MTTKELVDEYGLNYSEIRYCTGSCEDKSEFGCNKRKHRNKEIIKELEASIRKEVEKEYGDRISKAILILSYGTLPTINN